MSWSAEFNGGAILSSGVTLSHTRAYATVGAAGETYGVNEPVYAAERLFVAPPVPTDVVTLDASASTANVPAAVGEWSDGQPCAVHLRNTSISRISIQVGAPITTGAWTAAASRNCDILCTSTPDATFNPSGRKNGLQDMLRGAGTAQGEDGAWIYSPRSWQICGGGVFVACEALEWNGSIYQSRAVALVRWDDSLPGAGGTNKFRLHFRSPSIQNGQARGAQWMMPQVFDLGTQNEKWLTFTDYRTNPGSAGGEAYLVRLTKDGPNSPFVPGTVLPLTNIVRDASVQGLHCHCAGVTPWGNGGMAVVVIFGDATMSQTVVCVRGDRNYLQGHTLGIADTTPSSVTFVAPFPTNATAASATSNGWTVFPFAGGNQYGTANAATFSGATWTDAGRTLAAAALDAGTIGNRAGMYIIVNAGTGVTQPTLAKVTAHTTTTMTLDVDINGGSGNASDIGGIICNPEQCHQPVACAQLPDGRLYFGADESSPIGTICNLPTFVGNDTTIRWELAQGRGITSHLREWNQFHAVFDPRNRENLFVGCYTSSSTTNGWSTSTPPGRIMYGDGNHFAAFYAPNISAASGVARMGVYRITDDNSWFLYGPVSQSVLAIRTPRWARKVRPLISCSPAITQHLTTGIGTHIDAGNNAGDTVEVTRSQLPLLIQGQPLPLPPTQGTIQRILSRHPWASTRVRTGSTLDKTLRVRVGGYLMTVPEGNPNTTPPFAAATTQSLLWLGEGTNFSTLFSRSSIGSLNRLDGTGQWIPFSYDAGPASGWTNGASIPGTFPLGISFRTENGNRYYSGDMLVALDYITTGDGEYPAISPPPVAGTYAEARTRLTVPRAGAEWTFTAAVSIPPLGGDEYAAGRNANRALFTLSDGTRYLRVTADPGNNRISVTDGTNTVHCTAPAGQEMNFDRNSQIFLALSLTGTTLRVAASVDGTIVNAASGTIIPVRYDRVLSGDQNNVNGEPTFWWQMRGWDGLAADANEVAAMAQNIGGPARLINSDTRQRVLNRGTFWQRAGRYLGITKRV